MSTKYPTIASPRWIRKFGVSSLAYKSAMDNMLVSVMEKIDEGKKKYHVVFENGCLAIKPFGHESNAVRYAAGWNNLAEIRKANTCKV